MRRVYAAAAASVLAACAAGPATNPAYQTELQAHQVHQPELLAKPVLAPDKARLQVERDLTFAGGGCTYDLHLNGRRVASFYPGNIAAFDVPAGVYTFHMQSGGIICPPYASPGQQLQLAAGTVVRIRMGIEYMLGFIRVETSTP